MTRTELLTNLIKDHIEHDRFITVDTFRDMLIHNLPGRLALLAVSRDGEHILPIFDNMLFTTNDVINYTTIRETLGTDWTPVLGAQIWNRFPGQTPQTMLTTDGIVDERTLVRIFGDNFHLQHNMLGITGFTFGDFDINTLPRLAVYTIDIKGARRIRLANDVDEGTAFGIHLDNYGYIQYLNREDGLTMIARMEIGVDTYNWTTFPIKR